MVASGQWLGVHNGYAPVFLLATKICMGTTNDHGWGAGNDNINYRQVPHRQLHILASIHVRLVLNLILPFQRYRSPNESCLPSVPTLPISVYSRDGL